MSFRIKGNAQVSGKLKLPSEASQRALTVDANGELTSSNVTSSELGQLAGVTGPIQTQISAKVDSSEKGAANGIATLDGTGKIPAAQLPSAVMEFKGNWNASTNSPSLANGTGDSGDVYRTSVAGTQNLGSGNITFAVGDLVIYNGSVWQRSPASDAPVLSVNGLTGAVVLSKSDIGLGNVDNTSDANKPISTATQTALNGKANIITGAATTITSSNLTASRALTSDTSGKVAVSTVTSTELGFLSGVTSAIQTQFSAKADNTVAITTAANSGLAGGGTITTSRTLTVDINGTTAKTTPLNSDSILVQESGGNRRSITRANFLSGIAVTSPGDINETSFTLVNNQSTPANVTGFVFANATVRSFEALVSVEVTATSSLFEVFTVRGIQRASEWVISVTSNGDDSLVNFDITSSGQITYTSGNYAGFTTGRIKFRAITTSV